MEFKYIDFIESPNNQDLVSEFLKELQDSNIDQLKLLFTIISEKKNKIKIKINKSEIDNVYLIMISCFIDSVLINLAKKFNFPRGFPILWIPQKIIKLFGFYPKFENDDRQEPDTDSEFDNVIKVEFFKKWSGFLGQICIFEYQRIFYWTCCSKNSCNYNSPFVIICKKLFSQLLNFQNIKNLLNNNYHLSAEIMSFDDQTHGSQVIKETPVITCIGQGSKFYLDKSNPNITIETMVQFLNPKDLVTYCNKYELPCDSGVIIKGTEARLFMNQLSRLRDFMTNQKLEDLIIQHKDNLEYISGNLHHNDILGNTLEGLVIKTTNITNKKEVSVTKKYKFPGYTVRTMVVRPILEKYNQNNLINYLVQESFKDYVNKWCVTPEGKEYWLHLLYSCAYVLKNEFHPNLDSKIGLHIQIMEYIEQQFIINSHNKFSDILPKYFHELENCFKSTVILCLGPIGSGKSVISNLITDNMSSTIEHIDGDLLDFDHLEDVLQLKSERNDYTIWLIIKSLMLHKIPILSTGGGLLYTFGKKLEFILRARINQILNIDVKILLLIPSNDITDFKLIDKNAIDLSKLYQDNKLVIQAIKHRVSSGKWKVPLEFYGKSSKKNKLEQENVTAFNNFSKKMANVSEKNRLFVENLLPEVDNIILFPLINSENYNQIINTRLDYSCINSKIIKSQEIPSLGNFMQYRILVKKRDNTYGHITIEFNKDRHINLSLDSIQILNNQIKDKVFYYQDIIITGISNLGNKNIVNLYIVEGLDMIVHDNSAHVMPHK